MTISAQTPDLPELNIATDKIAFIVEKAREFDVKEADSDPDSGSNATDDGNTDVLEDKADDPARQELVSFINGMNNDEKAELVAQGFDPSRSADPIFFDDRDRAVYARVDGGYVAAVETGAVKL